MLLPWVGELLTSQQLQVLTHPSPCVSRLDDVIYKSCVKRRRNTNTLIAAQVDCVLYRACLVPQLEREYRACPHIPFAKLLVLM